MSVAVNSSNSQTLPPREASLFKKILKHFKDKQFKSGLKVSNQILANPKYAEHGETLSMKGLILNSMGKRAEAFEYVKRGLKNDVRSHVCWHVFGLLQKADHKYEEAIKCYRNALRLKKDSVQILSDLSLVQIQTRDLEGYRDSRYQLFLLRPGERSTWIGCAMAYHLTGDHATAVNILGEYQKTNASTGVRKNSNSSGSRRNNEAYEQSELLLYNVSILLESRRFDEALSLLISNQADIVDKVAYYELTTEIYLALNKFADAQKIVVEELISRNAENANYCRLLERSVRLAAAGKQQGQVNKRSGDEGSGGDFGDELQRLELYEKLAAQYPRSQTIARLPLNFITDLTAFTRKIDAYLRRGFRKGQPAMFRDLKHLYNSELVASRCLESFTCELRAGQASVEALNSCLLTVAVKTAADSSTPFSPKTISRPELETHLAASRRGRPPLPPKIAAIEALLLDYADNLKAHGSFEAPVAAAGNDTEKEEGEEEEAITCLLWVYYFLAQHFDALKEFSLALHFANAALLHTPTLIDVFVIKAKIFKHAGFPEKAARYLEEAASLDTSDRYLNCKAAKYLIRINKLKEAEEMCVKFTREGVPAVENLNEMQCMWFLTEMAAAYQRMGMLGEAMKKCIEVDNHFAEINEDQFDFNTYCMLKVTLRAYVQMIRLEDHLKSHRFFLTAARAAIEIYLRLHDKPVSNKEEEGDSANSQMSASELRKMRNKQRKAQLKAEKENAEKAGAKKGGEKRDAESKSEFAEVVDVAKLEKTETPLDDVMRFLAPYKLFGRHLLEAHFLAFEVYARKGKLLLQLQSLKRAFRLMESAEGTGAQEQGGQKKVVTQKHQQHHQPRLYRQCALFLSALLTRRDSGTMPEAMRHVLNEQLGQQVSSLGSLLFGGGPGQQNKTGAGGDQQKQTDLLSQLPSTAEFLQRTLPHRSPSFTVRVERIKAEHYLATVAEEAAENANQSNSTTNTAAAPVPVVKAKQLKAASQFTEEMIGELVKDAEAGSLSQLTLEGALALYGAVKSAAYGQLSAPRLEALRQTLHRLYPLASRFMLEKELAELEVELRDADYFTADTEEGGGGSGGGQGKETTEKVLNPVTTNHCES